MQYHKHIFTPGPVRMSEQILRIGAEQTPYFRNDAFSAVLKQCERDLLALVNAPENSRVIFLTASGTAGMEAAVANLLGEKDRALVVDGGSFGHRFVELCKRHGVGHTAVDPCGTNLGDTAALNGIDATALLINAHETSVGVLYDLEAVGEACRQKGWLNIVDAISMFVTDPLDMQAHSIDALIISSHKGLALPPGLSMVVLTPRAIGHLLSSNTLYFDFRNYLDDGARGQTPYTPAVTIILQLQHRLAQIRSDGIAAEQAKAAAIATYFRDAILPLSLKPYTGFMPNAMTTLSPTDGRSAFDIVHALDTKYDIVVAPSGGALRDRIFRVAHMGAVTHADTDILIDALFDYYGVKR